ncbi:hypothetical protein ACP70R_022256 [Stipagrostis hirtigluma subsp. patula]
MEGAMVSALTGVMKSLLCKLGDLVGSEYKSLKGVRKEIRFLESELCSMNALLQRLADMEEIDTQMKEWKDRVRELAYDVEDCIDIFMHYHRPIPINDRVPFMKKVGWKLKKLQVSHGITRKIQELKARVMEESERHKRYDLNIFHNSEPDMGTTSSSVRIRIDPRLSALYVETERLVGIEGPRNKIIRWLMEKQGSISEQLRTLSIVGCGGLGKTTLANQVYLEIKSQFECSSFVTVSQNPNVKLILKKILSDIAVMSDGILDDEQYLINKLRGYLQDKGYFIVVDDIWDAHTWRIIQCALVKNSCGSRIITTTRINDVAKACSSSHGDQIHEMKLLGAVDSKRLFFRRIFGSDGESCPAHLKHVSDDILKKCGGLPLAIISIASLLAGIPKSREQWDNLKYRVNSAHENSPDIEIMRWVLSLSYFGLPDHLKTCLLYLSVFPEDYVIKKDRLVSRWIAEGFIHGIQEQCLYEVGESYFNQLINRCLIQPADITDDGQVNACRVHDTILDFIVSRSTEENFVLPFGASTVLSVPIGKIRRLSLHNNNEENAIIPTNLIGCHVRSLTSFLRYLNIKGTDISQLPRQIGELQYLETLDIRSTAVRELPSTIVRLIRLVRLLVDYPVKLPEGIGNMEALEELSCFSVFMYSANFLLELGQLTNLRVLRVIWNRTEFEGDAGSYMEHLSVSLSKLGRCYLQSLSLDIHGLEEDDFSIDLWHPAPHKLQKFCIEQWQPISKIPSWMRSLINLQHLKLYVRNISQEDVKMLESMPILLTLVLSSETALEERLVISCQGFQNLTFFKFHCDRVGLTFEAGSMSKLEHLRIVISAFQMKSPDGSFDFGIQHLSCLTKIYFYINCYGLTDEEVEAAENAIRIAAGTIPMNHRLHIDRRFAPF